MYMDFKLCHASVVLRLECGGGRSLGATHHTQG
jgi:hypothetical protein